MSHPTDIGPYRLQGLLHETAVSRVYAAERTDGALPGPLVVKLYTSVDDAFANALAERARALVEVASPHILQVLDVGRVGPQLVVVRPRLRALTLGELVERARAQRRPVTHGVAVRAVLDVLAGLHAAHGHRRPGNLEPWLTHGEVGPDHVMVDDTGRGLVLGVETPRGPQPGVASPLKFDLSGACALLYDLLAPRKSAVESTVPGAPIPPAFAALLTAAMGLGGATRHHTALELRDAMLATARSAQVSVASPEEVGNFVRRLLDSSPPAEGPPAARRPSPSPVPAATPAAPALPGMADLPAPGGGLFNVPRPVSGIFTAPKKPPRLGEVLLQRGLVSQVQLDAALGRQKTSGGRLGALLLEDHLIDDAALADALAQLSGHPRASDDDIRRARPGDLLTATMPPALAVQKRLMPVQYDAATGHVTIAVEDPFDQASVRQAQLLVGASGVKLLIARRTALEELLRTLYPREFPPPASATERTDPLIIHVDDEPPPAAAPPPPAMRAVAPPRAPIPGNPLVLVCEPDAAIANTLSQRLKGEDLRVLHVTDGNQARAAIEREVPAAIISEAALPRVDGFNLLLGVRARDATREVPFFIISARADERQTSKAMELGADDFLAKPLNVELLVGKLRRALQKYQAMVKSMEEAEAQRRNAEAARESAATPAPRAEPTGVIGSLSQMGLPEIVQSLELGRKTAIVTLMFQDKGEGSVSFMEGEVINAQFAGKQGEDAFYEMARQRQGLFRIHYGKPKDPRVIKVSTTFLLLEAMRRIDEENPPSSS
ncbi:MAG: response regulator [Deltaproteobacteria bacterium]|nr:response regulator [Deltaproteobacteria bacterium]